MFNWDASSKFLWHIKLKIYFLEHVEESDLYKSI
jgi:hypothetical protein